MSDRINEVLDSLRGELEKFAEMARTAGAAGEEAKADVAERVKGALADVRETFERVEHGLKSGAKTADDYVRKNPWFAIGAVALVAYLLGTLSRRDR